MKFTLHLVCALFLTEIYKANAKSETKTFLRRLNSINPSDDGDDHDQDSRDLQAKDQSCTLLVYDDGEGGPQKAACEMDGGLVYNVVTWPSGFVAAQIKSGNFKSGVSRLDLTDVQVDQKHNLKPPQNPKLLLKPQKLAIHRRRDRHLAVVEGNKRILIVRVIAADASTAHNETRLSDDVFGNGNPAYPVTLKSQLGSCSAGKLNIVQAPARIGTNYNIANGVVTVPLPTVSTSAGDVNMRNNITESLKSNFGVPDVTSLTDHAMYCIPAATMTTLSYAFVNHWMMVFPDTRCLIQSSQMHELGHNLNLAHSGQGTDAYGDQSGAMGYTYGSDSGPNMCYNAAKSWQLQWYKDKHVVVDINTPYAGQLAGIVDYQTATAGVPVLIKINSITDTDYYVEFNRQASFNSGTVEGANQVTVVKQSGEGTVYSESSLMATLGTNGVYKVPDFDGNIGRNLTISVTAISSTAATVDIRVTRLPCNVKSDCPSCHICNAAKECEPENVSVAGQLAVSLKTDSYGSETSWEFMTASGQILLSGKGYSSSTAYSPSYNISTSCGMHIFTMKDSFGDGMCCTYGQGSYSVSWEGVVKKTGGTFGSSEVTSFMVEPPSPQCTSDADCSDGQYCNGVERCSSGLCVAGTQVVCTQDGFFCNGIEICDEASKSCKGTPVACDDGDKCNGDEICDESLQGCRSGTPVTCPTSTCGLSNMVCNAATGVCETNPTNPLGYDGVCNRSGGETCETCPQDCTASFGPVCGNGKCETGEDCTNCAKDCSGSSQGKTKWCCAGGTSSGCSVNVACNTNGFQCSSSPTQTGTSCCGNLICEGTETYSSCPSDCPLVTTTTAATTTTTVAATTAASCGPCAGKTKANCQSCGICKWYSSGGGYCA